MMTNLSWIHLFSFYFYSSEFDHGSFVFEEVAIVNVNVPYEKNGLLHAKVKVGPDKAVDDASLFRNVPMTSIFPIRR